MKFETLAEQKYHYFINTLSFESTKISYLEHVLPDQK